VLKDLVYLELAVDEASGDTSVSTPPEVTPTASEGDVTASETPVETPVETPETFFEIDGEKLTPEQIKEYRQGYLRQGDYTKKTQEIASLRKQNEQAVQLYEYLNSKPELIQKLRELDSEEVEELQNVYKQQDPVVNELSLKVKSMEINHELEMLKVNDPNLNEIEILNLATEKTMPVKDAYVMWKGMNFDKLLKEQLAKQSANLTEQIKKGQTVTTLMNTNEKSSSGSFGLSQTEMTMADKLGMTYEEYARWK
jgi:phage I-like protein